MKVTADDVFDKPVSTRARAQCDRCEANTTVGVKQRNFGVCNACRVFRRLSLRETLWCVPEAAEADVKEHLITQSTHALAASQMKKDWPLTFPAREWDAALVILVDERRRRREEAARYARTA